MSSKFNILFIIMVTSVIVIHADFIIIIITITITDTISNDKEFITLVEHCACPSISHGALHTSAIVHQHGCFIAEVLTIVAECNLVHFGYSIL